MTRGSDKPISFMPLSSACYGTFDLTISKFCYIWFIFVGKPASFIIFAGAMLRFASFASALATRFVEKIWVGRTGIVCYFGVGPDKSSVLPPPGFFSVTN
jgi:hypothetical protein